jgi:phytol kinase
MRPAVIAAGLMPMTWGDAFAAILGRRWGRHRYAIGGSTRSLEGSAAMFLFSLASTFLVLWGFGTPLATAGLDALIVAVVATVVEAISIKGLDNITVPLLSALTLWLLTGW